MDLLRVLAMPFQLSSVLFVGASSLLLAWSTSLGGVWMVIGFFQYWLMLVWLVNFALRLVDDAANGLRQTAVASYEMMADPFLDLRGMVHPVLAAAAGITHLLRPHWPMTPLLVVAVVLFPASIGACAMSGRTRDALNPAAIWNVVRGLGAWYALLVLFVAACAFTGVLLVRGTLFNAFGSRALLFFCLQLLVLVAYAGIGGALYLRRFELGFEPRVSPERKDEQQNSERARRRQVFLDGLYNDLRVRDAARATAKAKDWFSSVPPEALAGDFHALLAAGREWHEPREYPRLLGGLLPVLFGMRQPALAMNAADAGLAANRAFAPADEATAVLAANRAFAPADEATAVALIGYALQAGRRRAAEQLLANYLKADGAKAPPGPQLTALCRVLQPQAVQ
jgi:hypothetical protein